MFWARISDRLYVENNELTGPLPSELGLMTRLQRLTLEHNTLTGNIPTELGSLVVNGPLSTLTLANNSLSGTIPEGLCSLGVLVKGWGVGLSFDCNDHLWGCCWCPCPGSNYSGDCDTRPGMIQNGQEHFHWNSTTQI